MPLLLLLLAACLGRAPAPSPSPCVRWLGDPVRVSPQGPAPRHHPTAARLPGGDLLVTWQVGRAGGRIATRTLAPDLAPRGPERVVSGDDRRATHPQASWGGGRGGVAWTREEDGALRWQEVDGTGAPLGTSQVLLPGASGPALYPDVSHGADGEAVLVWYGEGARWGAARLDAAGLVPHALTVRPDTTAGGPPAAAHHPDGGAWLAWPELRVDPAGGGTSHLRAAGVGPSGPEAALELLTSPQHFQRLALGFTGDRLVAAWTRYPAGSSGWGVWAGAWTTDGAPVAPPRRLDRQGGRMIDLAAAGEAVVVAWEEPTAASDRDLLVQVLDPELSPACPPVPAHPPSRHEETRAQVLAWDQGDRVEGVVFWQAGPHRREQAVWGRRFAVPAGISGGG